MQGPSHALGPQVWAGPDEGHWAEALSLSRTAIHGRQGQNWQVDWVPALLEYGDGRLSIEDLGKEAHWSLMGTAMRG